MTGSLQKLLIPHKGNIITDSTRRLIFRQFTDISDVPCAAMLKQGTYICEISNGDCRLALDTDKPDRIFVTDLDSDDEEEYTDPAKFPGLLKAFFKGKLGDITNDGEYAYRGRHYYISIDELSEYRCSFQKKDPGTGKYEEIEAQYLYDLIGKDLGPSDKETLKSIMTKLFNDFVSEWDAYLETGKVTWQF